MSSVLKWEPYLNSERAQVGALEFFVCATQGGADLYCDSMSFDQGYGCVSYASVEAAKSAAEELARYTFDELAALFAPVPVLRWVRSEHVEEATIAGVVLTVSESGWTARVVHTGKVIDCGWVSSDGIAAARACAVRCASRLGLSFRTEDE